MTKIANIPPRHPIDLKEARASETEAPAANPAPPAASPPSPSHERLSANSARRQRARIQTAPLGPVPAAHSSAEASSQTATHPVSRSLSQPGTVGVGLRPASTITRGAQGHKEPPAEASSTAHAPDNRTFSQASSQKGKPNHPDDTLGPNAPQIRQPSLGRSAQQRLMSSYEKASAPAQHSDASAARHQVKAALKQKLEWMAKIGGMLKQQRAISLQWEPNCGPLPGTPDIAWDTIKPTGDLPEEGGFGCVVNLQAKRNGPVSGNDQEQHVQLAAKFIFDEHGMPGQATGKAGPTDKLREELAIYRQVIDAQSAGKALGRHQNLCEIYGIVTMTVDGAEMRALLMEAVPGHNAQKTTDILRRCLDANYLSPREYWGAIQYLCDSTLDASERLREAGVALGDLKQDNIFVRADGAVKVVDYGPATGPGDMRIGGTPANMSEDHFDEIQRRIAQDPAVTTSVNQMSSAYSNFVNSVLRKTGTQKPVMPDEAKRTDFINDPMMGHEEAQAVIRVAFELAEIEGKGQAGAPWERRPDARKSALRLIERKQAQKPEEGKLHSVHDESILTPPSLSLFLENPNLENYIHLKQHYSNTQEQDKLIENVLKSMPPAALQVLNNELSSSFLSRGKELYKNGSWINDFKPGRQSGRKMPPAPKLRSYIDDASKLFKELQAVAHDLTPVDWSHFKELGALTKTALGLIRNATGHDRMQQSQSSTRIRGS